MKFSSKIFLSILLVAVLISGGLSTAFYVAFKKHAEETFFSKYTSITENVGETLQQLEGKTDTIMKNAAAVVGERLKRPEKLTERELKAYVTQLGVTHLYVTNPQGKFVLSTREHPSKLPNIFSFCPLYKPWFLEGTPFHPTGLVPGIPAGTPNKFLLSPTADRKYIVEVAMEADFLGKTVQKTLAFDAEILSVGLASPNGTNLGWFNPDGGIDYSRSRKIEPVTAGRYLNSDGSWSIVRQVPATEEFCCSCNRAKLTLDGKYYYLLTTRVSSQALNQSLRTIAAFAFLLFGVAFLIAFWISKELAFRLVSRIDLINTKVDHIMQSGEGQARIGLRGSDEVSNLARNFDHMFEVLEKRSAAVLEAERHRAAFHVAQQVAHDIRSPLAALVMLERSLGALPEDMRILTRSAVSRIRDITNQLLEKNRTEDGTTQKTRNGLTEPSESSPQLLSSLLESVITEKHIRYRSKIGVEIEANLDTGSYGLFAVVQPVDFKRVIANLVNNAVEALPEDTGNVSVTLLGDEDGIEIAVQDNGKGIEPEILARLTQRGETHGKSGGTGLGLYHARTSCETWGGALNIHSQVGVGTTVVLKLPRATPPAWFVDRLLLTPDSTVVVLDDDQSIHQIWQGRLEAARIQEKKIDLVHLSTPEELRKLKSSLPAGKPVHYLVDFELLGHEVSGLDLIEELGIAQQSILVTSRFEEIAIRARCLELGVRLIPKGMAGFVPIKVLGESGHWDAVLVDDDPVVHLSWGIAAKTQGKRLRAFTNAKEFREELHLFNSTTPIYLDCELEGQTKGEEVAKELHQAGFTDLYMATGYEADRFEAMPWLKVRGKLPPWIDGAKGGTS